MSDLERWSLLVGILSPLLISVIQQPGWRRPLRAIVGLIMCVLIALGTAYFNGDFHERGIVSSLLLIFLAAMTAYRNLWRPTGIAPAIETATSPTSTGRPADTIAE